MAEESKGVSLGHSLAVRESIHVGLEGNAVEL